MKYKITLNEYTEHPHRQALSNVGIAQYDLALAIGINQSQLSQWLRGISPMPETVENEIKIILEKLQEPEPEPAKKKRKIKPIPKGGNKNV